MTFTRAQVRALDRAAIETYGIPGIVLMENAATAIEEVCLGVLSGVDEPTVLILAGPGNNGGDGLAVARKLHNRGTSVSVVLAGAREKYSGDAAANLVIAEQMGLPCRVIDTGDVGGMLTRASGDGGGPLLIIDALLGTGIAGEPRSPMDEIIAWMEGQRRTGAKVLAIDVPTGLDCDTGAPFGAVCVHADVTVTLAGMKVGLARDQARQFAGEVFVGDIGVPRALLRKIGERRQQD